MTHIKEPCQNSWKKCAVYHCFMIRAVNLLIVKASVSSSPTVVLLEQAASVCVQTLPGGHGEISSLCSAMISANSHAAAHKASICSSQQHSNPLQLHSLIRGFFHICSGPSLKSMGVDTRVAQGGLKMSFASLKRRMEFWLKPGSLWFLFAGFGHSTTSSQASKVILEPHFSNNVHNKEKILAGLKIIKMVIWQVWKVNHLFPKSCDALCELWK